VGGVGAQGPPGPAGAQGPTGPPGLQGAQGAIGAQGGQGFQGATGAQGAIGPAGSQGFQGATGAQGPPSDKRLKDNITPIKDVLYKTKQVHGVMFEWDSEHTKIKNNKSITFQEAFSGDSIGFIAQDLEEVIPEIVFTDDEGWKSVNYGQMVSLGIGGIQEQKRRVDSIYERINKLKQIIGV
jgi:hypothetical protein